METLERGGLGWNLWRYQVYGLSFGGALGGD